MSRASSVQKRLLGGGASGFFCSLRRLPATASARTSTACSVLVGSNAFAMPMGSVFPPSPAMSHCLATFSTTSYTRGGREDAVIARPAGGGGDGLLARTLSPLRLPFHPSSIRCSEGKNNKNSSDDFIEKSDDDLHGDLAAAVAREEGSAGAAWGSSFTGGGGVFGQEEGGMAGLKRVNLIKLDRPPGRFDLLTNSLCYKWETTAADARKVSGPLREWAAELKYRTGVHMELEPTNPHRLALPKEEGGYATGDEVEITIFLFGSERGIFNCAQLMESIVDQEPAYVRLAVFRRIPAEQKDGKTSPQQGSEEGVGGNVEWLLLRRINRELRPPDIPPISLKLPGKYTLLYEQFKEAAIRTLWEETGITVDPAAVHPTGRLSTNDPQYYWRVPVHYFIAEVPYEVEVKGPQTEHMSYMRDWDRQLLRQSPDPIDRAWAALANPETGCAWMRQPMIDELQRELRGENYMKIRYTPPPYTELSSVVGLSAED